MSLPKVTINYLNGMLGTIPENQDGLLAVAGAAKAINKFELYRPYTIRRPSDVEELGFTQAIGDELSICVQNFYKTAPEGTPLVLCGYADTSEGMGTFCKEKLRELITTSKGSIRGIIVTAYGNTPLAETLVTDAQNAANWGTINRYAPIFVILEDPNPGNSSVTVKDLDSNRVGVFAGKDEQNRNGSGIGLLAGRIASIPVQRNIGRVKDGPLPVTAMHIDGKLVENRVSTIESLYTRGYITPRTYVGKSGYFFTDDCLACKTEDDYHSLALRRVADKAYRIAYSVMLEELLDEIYVNEDGTMQPVIIKSLQARLEDAINKQMTAKGELSADASNGESGCICYINEKQDVLTTSTINMELKIRPFAYARYININLGFQVKSSND